MTLSPRALRPDDLRLIALYPPVVELLKRPLGAKVIG